MIRILLTYVLPLILPTALYLLWARRAAARGLSPDIPYPWLAAAGVALLALTVFALSLRGGTPGGKYEPPRYEDGRVVPGHVVD